MLPDFIQSMLFLHLIQVSFVGVLAWAAWRLLAQDQPHLAHAIWALVFIKCLTPPLISSPTSPFSWDQRPVARNTMAEVGELVSVEPTAVFRPLSNERFAPVPDQATEAVRIAVDGQPVEIRQPYQCNPYVYAWMNGALAGLLSVVLRYALFNRHVRRIPMVHHATAKDVMKRLIRSLQIKRRVRLLVIDGPIGPAVLGVLRPTILLPAVIVRGKTAAELEPLIAHELIHIRRGDLAWALMQSVAKSLWWFHPLIRFAGRMLTRESERSCDEENVSNIGCAPSVYARSLLDVLEQKHR